MTRLVLVVALLSSSVALAQSKEDKRASLVGQWTIGYKETGVGGLGGGSLGSPYLLQLEERLKPLGVKVVDAETASGKGLPIYEVFCTSMDGGDATVRVACQTRLLRSVRLDADTEQKRDVYAATWTSSFVIGSFAQDRIGDVPKLTAGLADAFAADFSSVNPQAATAKKKK